MEDRTSIFLRLGAKIEASPRKKFGNRSRQPRNENTETNQSHRKHEERMVLTEGDRSPFFVTESLGKQFADNDQVSPSRKHGSSRRGRGRRGGNGGKNQYANNTPSILDRLTFTNKHPQEIEHLKAKLEALEREKQDAKDLNELLMVNNYKLQNEKSKIQQEKNVLEREQNALLERLAYFHSAIDEPQTSIDHDHLINEPISSSGAIVPGSGGHSDLDVNGHTEDHGLFTAGGEPPITPDSGILKAISALRIQPSPDKKEDQIVNTAVAAAADGGGGESLVNDVDISDHVGGSDPKNGEIASLAIKEFATKLKF